MYISHGGYYEAYPLRTFVMDVGELVFYLFPVVILVVLWKIFVVNRTAPRGNILSLGLDNTTATHAELYGRRIPWLTLFLRVLVGAITFQLGVSAFQVASYLQRLLRTYFEC